MALSNIPVSLLGRSIHGCPDLLLQSQLSKKHLNNLQKAIHEIRTRIVPQLLGSGGTLTTQLETLKEENEFGLYMPGQEAAVAAALWQQANDYQQQIDSNTEILRGEPTLNNLLHCCRVWFKTRKWLDDPSETENEVINTGLYSTVEDDD